jgi:hypothetical protein
MIALRDHNHERPTHMKWFYLMLSFCFFNLLCILDHLTHGQPAWAAFNALAFLICTLAAAAEYKMARKP